VEGVRGEEEWEGRKGEGEGKEESRKGEGKGGGKGGGTGKEHNNLTFPTLSPGWSNG